MPWLTGAGTGTRIARVVMEEEYSVMGARGARAGGGQGAGGRGGPRGVCLRVPAAPPRSAAASDLREGGRRASRAVAGAGWGEATNLNTTSGGGVRGDRGQVERCAHRSTDERRCRRGTPRAVSVGKVLGQLSIVLVYILGQVKTQYKTRSFSKITPILNCTTPKSNCPQLY